MTGGVQLLDKKGRPVLVSQIVRFELRPGVHGNEPAGDPIIVPTRPVRWLSSEVAEKVEIHAVRWTLGTKTFVLPLTDGPVRVRKHAELTLEGGHVTVGPLDEEGMRTERRWTP